MKLIADLHTHTVASTHAFSTIGEMADGASSLGLRAMAVTDHGIGMPDAPHKWYFNNLVRLPDILPNGLLLLKGVEANVLDAQGTLDMKAETLKELDWVIASMHHSCISPLSVGEATNAWLAIAQNPYVDMIGHCEQREHRFDYDCVTKAFTTFGKVVEINANSWRSRPGNEENLRNIALACKKNGTFVSVNSDAHSAFGLANQESVLPMLQEIEFPEQLIVNASMPRLLEVLQQHNRSIVKRIEGTFQVG